MSVQSATSAPVLPPTVSQKCPPPQKATADQILPGAAGNAEIKLENIEAKSISETIRNLKTFIENHTTNNFNFVGISKTHFIGGIKTYAEYLEKQMEGTTSAPVANEQYSLPVEKEVDPSNPFEESSFKDFAVIAEEIDMLHRNYTSNTKINFTEFLTSVIELSQRLDSCTGVFPYLSFSNVKDRVEQIAATDKSPALVSDLKASLQIFHISAVKIDSLFADELAKRKQSWKATLKQLNELQNYAKDKCTSDVEIKMIQNAAEIADSRLTNDLYESMKSKLKSGFELNNKAKELAESIRSERLRVIPTGSDPNLVGWDKVVTKSVTEILYGEFRNFPSYLDIVTNHYDIYTFFFGKQGNSKTKIEFLQEKPELSHALEWLRPEIDKRRAELVSEIDKWHNESKTTWELSKSKASTLLAMVPNPFATAQDPTYGVHWEYNILAYQLSKKLTSIIKSDMPSTLPGAAYEHKLLSPFDPNFNIPSSIKEQAAKIKNENIKSSNG